MILAAISLAALATVSLPVGGADVQSQAAIDRGLFLYYAYDPGDASQAFADAAVRQPGLAMAYWGEALADGPDLNTPETAQMFADAQSVIARAKATEASVSPRERSFIDAMASRYAGTWDDWERDDAAYRAAMVTFAKASGDENAELLAAEALLEHGNTPGALDLIDRVIAIDPQNPMANHLCIHAYDGVSDRTPALLCAQRLDAASFPPQAEHLAHMPAHYWIETGDYASAIVSSERTFQLLLQLDAIDHRDLAQQRYADHDISVGYSAAMMLGSYAQAQVWSGRMNLVFARNFDALTALRFDRFDRALAGGSDELFDLPIEGLAALALHRTDKARQIAARIEQQNGGPPTHGYLPQLFFARLAEVEGKDADARSWLQRALQNQEVEYYAEIIPNIPAQEALGGYLLRRASYAQAAGAFDDCLKTYPNDPRALFGLAAALAAQGKAADAAAVRERFDEQWKGADTTLTIDAL